MAATIRDSLYTNSPQPSLMQSPPLDSSDVSKVRRVFMTYRNELAKACSERSMIVDPEVLKLLDSSEEVFVAFIKAGEAFDRVHARDFCDAATMAQVMRQVGLTQLKMSDEFEEMDALKQQLEESLPPKPEMIEYPHFPAFRDQIRAESDKLLRWEKQYRIFLTLLENLLAGLNQVKPLHRSDA